MFLLISNLKLTDTHFLITSNITSGGAFVLYSSFCKYPYAT